MGELSVAVIAVVVSVGSFAAGALAVLAVVVWRALGLLSSARHELTSTTAGLQAVHNDLAKKVLEIDDRLSAHDFKLSAARPK